MSESIIADFVGKFNSDVSSRPEPARGRVLLSQRRLVLAAGEGDTLTVPLSAIFDVAVGHVPPDLGDFFQSTVTVAFERGENRFVVVVEAEDDKISKFSTVLFKALLNGTETSVKDRARVGGRVTDEEYRTATLFLRSGVVEFRRADESFEVSLATVVDFDRTTREVEGEDRPVLTFRHSHGDRAITTLVAIPSPRKMAILGRFLRLEYSDRMQDLRDLELSQRETEILVAMYSTGDLEGMPLSAIVGAEQPAVAQTLETLEEHGLVTGSGDAPSLTPKGQVVASQHLGRVNA